MSQPLFWKIRVMCSQLTSNYQGQQTRVLSTEIWKSFPVVCKVRSSVEVGKIPKIDGRGGLPQESTRGSGHGRTTASKGRVILVSLQFVI